MGTRNVQVKIREIAKTKGKSIYRLCKETGIPETLMYRYMKGQVIPRVDRALRIADTLGVSLSDIWIFDRAA